jgi:hypothetical protein
MHKLNWTARLTFLGVERLTGFDRLPTRTATLTEKMEPEHHDATRTE